MRREKYSANAISDFHAISKRGMRGIAADEWREGETIGGREERTFERAERMEISRVRR